MSNMAKRHVNSASIRNNIIRSSWWTTYLDNHAEARRIAWRRLKQTPIASLLTLIVVALALALPAGLFVTMHNVQLVTGHWPDSTQLNLFLKADTSQTNINKLIQRLQNSASITHVKYTTAEQGLKQFERKAGLKQLDTSLSSNPIPAMIAVTPHPQYRHAEGMNVLQQQLQQLPEVEDIFLDMAWVKRLQSMIKLAHQVGQILVVTFALAVMLIVMNTIRLSVQKYQRETEVMSLVGATASFIRRPFLYMGAFYGGLGAILTWIILHSFLLALSGTTDELASLYQNSFSLHGLTWQDSFDLIVMGLVLGISGAWLACR